MIQNQTYTNNYLQSLSLIEIVAVLFLTATGNRPGIGEMETEKDSTPSAIELSRMNITTLCCRSSSLSNVITSFIAM